MTIKKTPQRRAAFFVFFDIFISLFTLFLSYNLRFNFEIEPSFMDNFLHAFVVIVILKILAMAYFNIYRVAWRFFSLKEAKKLFLAHVWAYGIFAVIFYIKADFFIPFPRSVIVIDMFLSLIFIGFFRVLKRLIIEESKSSNLKKGMLIGATGIAQSIIKEKNDFYIDAIVDNDETVVGSFFSNIRVENFSEIEKIVKEHSIESVIITKELEKNILKSIFERLHSLGVRDILISTLSHNETRVKNLEVEDLLARNPKDLDREKIKEFIKDKVVLVTGAGGSIGSEICKQCEHFGAKELILLDNAEFNLYKISEDIKDVKSYSYMRSVVGMYRVEECFKNHKLDIVIHAAAYKHVPLVESNIDEAIKNNIIGTKNIIDLSIKYGVKKVVLISTDKAVRPTSVMGATKRVCELYAQNVVSLENNTVSLENNTVSLENVKTDKTEIVAVRFGNVLGSSGSVIPKFKSQIQKGGPITVTHPDVTRYFMLISEACELVLQAASIGKGKEIFILDMGDSIKIVDLAKKMCELSARDDIKIEFTGLRDGEKLYEELLLDESDAKTEYESITIAKPTHYDIERLNRDIKELLTCKDKIAKLKEIVPEFYTT